MTLQVRSICAGSLPSQGLPSYRLISHARMPMRCEYFRSPVCMCPCTPWTCPRQARAAAVSVDCGPRRVEGSNVNANCQAPAMPARSNADFSTNENHVDSGWPVAYRKEKKLEIPESMGTVRRRLKSVKALRSPSNGYLFQEARWPHRKGIFIPMTHSMPSWLVPMIV